ncbi:MAG: Eco57I restriction-modification methylase domain-containing protein, partial [Oscillospiraceae bacterium]
VKQNYPETKSDMFACFIEKGFSMAKRTGFISMITMESWMFLSSFEKMRQSIVTNKTIVNMVHMPYLGKGGTSLGINFGTAAVVFNNKKISNYAAQYDYVCYYETDDNGIPFEFPVINERYKTATTENFKKIPGAPIAYWVSERMLGAFSKSSRLDSVAYSFQGIITGDNNY